MSIINLQQVCHFDGGYFCRLDNIIIDRSFDMTNIDDYLYMCKNVNSWFFNSGNLHYYNIFNDMTMWSLQSTENFCKLFDTHQLGEIIEKFHNNKIIIDIIEYYMKNKMALSCGKIYVNMYGFDVVIENKKYDHLEILIETLIRYKENILINFIPSIYDKKPNLETVLWLVSNFDFYGNCTYSQELFYTEYDSTEIFEFLKLKKVIYYNDYVRTNYNNSIKTNVNINLRQYIPNSRYRLNLYIIIEYAIELNCFNVLIWLKKTILIILKKQLLNVYLTTHLNG